MSYSLAQKTFTSVAPEKGSFPLDHQGFCKQIMIKYLRCLMENKNQNSICKNVAKEYLGCRMEHNLMALEEWSSLGFAEDTKET